MRITSAPREHRVAFLGKSAGAFDVVGGAEHALVRRHVAAADPQGGLDRKPAVECHTAFVACNAKGAHGESYAR